MRVKRWDDTHVIMVPDKRATRRLSISHSSGVLIWDPRATDRPDGEQGWTVRSSST